MKFEVDKLENIRRNYKTFSTSTYITKIIELLEQLIILVITRLNIQWEHF